MSSTYTFTKAERLSLIRRFRKCGAPYSEIAEVVGLTRQRVHQICKIYNIKKGENNNGENNTRNV